ncbi:MAG TPA: hypothetical protein VGF91_00520 [Solirubrobacteraceae bacterium]|jgi:hypothetical protein
MSTSNDYTRDEWQEISASASFDNVPTHQVALLHRHWIWANYSRRTHQDALANEDRNDVEDFGARTPWAMYTWYGLLCAVIEGLTDRQVRLGGRLVTDLRAIREPLREARNATFHVGGADGYWDTRLFEIATNPESAEQITRAHQAIGQLLLDELRRRNRDAGVG